jgi:hypothetical protein
MPPVFKRVLKYQTTDSGDLHLSHATYTPAVDYQFWWENVFFAILSSYLTVHTAESESHLFACHAATFHVKNAVRKWAQY